jgi:predicted double-glycine peptidase
MDQPTFWFLGLALLMVVSLVLGCWWGRRSPYRGWVMVAIGLVCLCCCSWLQRHPATAASFIPVGSWQYLEGTAAVPFFMLILGVVWSHSRRFRERGFVGVGVMIGALFFLQGAVWMVRTTPAHLFNETQASHMIVMQSQKYSCVPAASATALNMLGYDSTEAQMAAYTHTRPGLGSTTIRAADGLARRLDGTGISVRIVKADVQKLVQLPAPMLLTVNFDSNPGYNHMIVILETNSHGANVLDPTDGLFFIPWSAMEDVIAGPAIIFEHPRVQQAMLSVQ